MDWILWLIVIVAIVAVVWWLLNRNNSRSSAGTGAPDTTDTSPAAAAAAAPVAPIATAAPVAGMVPAATSPAEPTAASEPPAGKTAAEEDAPAETEVPQSQAAPSPTHHPEYTDPHAPTLPGAESAAAETDDMPAEKNALAEAEIRQTTQSAAAAETFASHSAGSAGHESGQPAPAAEPSGHLAVEQPYGEGSAAPAPDGSGPDDFSVKGDAASMVYYDETSPLFAETRAEVWFLSPAHAEAAGFRPPRRNRQ